MNIKNVNLVVVSMALLIGVACKKDDGRCPAGAKLAVTAEGKNKLESCRDSEDRLQGKQLLFFDNGKLGKEANYKDNQLNGSLTIWLKSGEMSSRGSFALGKKEGLFETWSKEGKKLSETRYANDKKSGLETLWFPNGNKASTGEYIEGRPHGKWTVWKDDGSVRSRTRYENGKVLGEVAEEIPPEIIQEATALDAKQTNAIGVAVQKRFQGHSLKSQIAAFEMGSSETGLYAKISFLSASKPRPMIETQLLGLTLAREVVLASHLITDVQVSEVTGRDLDSRRKPTWTGQLRYAGLKQLKSTEEAKLAELVGKLFPKE